MTEYLLTGGSGFVGSEVLKYLSDRVEVGKIYFATRDKSRIGGRGRVEPIYLQLPYAISVPRNVSVIVHCAGEKKSDDEMIEVNQEGTRRIVENAASIGVKRFIYVSSAGSYGAGSRAAIVSEDSVCTPRNRYEKTKFEGETHVQNLCRKYGIEYIILQPTNVISRGPETSRPLFGLISAVQSGRFSWISNHRSYLNYIDVENVARIAVEAAVRQHVTSGKYILNTPESLENVLKWISDELGVCVPDRRYPYWFAHALANVGDGLSYVLKRRMPFNTAKLKELTNTTIFNPKKSMTVFSNQYEIGVENLIRTLSQFYVSKGLL